MSNGPLTAMKASLALLSLSGLAAAVACGGAAPASERPEPVSSVHQEGQALPFTWREARLTPGGLLTGIRRGELRTIGVEDDGTGRIEVSFAAQRFSLNGREMPAAPESPVLRFISAPRGGVEGAMSVIGPPTSGEAIVAMLLPFAWPPVGAWPPPTDAEQTIGVSVGGADGAVTYQRRPAAPPGIQWITLRTDMRLPLSDRREERAVVGGVVGLGGGLEVAARLALTLPNLESDGGMEVEMVIGQGVPLPDAVAGGLLTCVDAVAALRARFDSVPLPPFVLNRPLSEELLAPGSAAGEGPGALLDLREESGGGRLRGLFDGLDEPLPGRDLAALGARVETRLRTVTEAMTMTARLTGLEGPAPTAPVYLLADAEAPAARVVSVAAALRRAGREARLVVRRPATEIGDGTSLRGSVWPYAERLAERATECPFIARAVAELQTRPVVASPGWVRAVVAGGVGACGCDPVMSEELERAATDWSDVARQSWGWLSLEGRVASAGAPVAALLTAAAP